MSADPRESAPPRTRRPVLITICAAPLLALMNYTAPMTTLPEITASLGAGVSGQTWILNGIALGLAALLLVSGSLADDYGRRRVLVAGAIVLAAASVVVATAPTTLVLVLGRVVQGAASAALLASSLGIVGHAYPPGPERNRATGWWGSMVSAGIALGPLLAGALTGPAGWRAAYWVFAIGAVALAVVARRTLPEYRSAVRRPVDGAGVATLGLGLTALLAGITQGRLGWTAPVTVGLLAAAVLLIAGFVLAESRGAAPMLDLALFRRPTFLASVGGAFLVGVAVIGLMSYLPTMMQHAHGFSALDAAWLFAIWSGVSFLVANQARRLPVPSRPQLALGLVLSGAGTLLLWGFAAGWSWPRAVAGLAVAGIGSGLANAALPRLAVESVPPERAGVGSGANNTARYVGSSLGVAMIVAVATSTGSLADGANRALVVAAAVTAAGAALVMLLRPAGE